MNEPVHIEGELVILRPVDVTDATDEYISWLNDSEVTKALETVPFPYTRAMLEGYLAEVISTPNTHMFMVLDKPNGRSIGTVKIHHVHPVHKTCHLGFMIGDRTYWGRGYGSDILRTAIRHAFTRLGVRKICESVNASNGGSLAIFRKNGFQEEGILKEQVLSGGRYEDKILLALFARDWKNP